MKTKILGAFICAMLVVIAYPSVGNTIELKTENNRSFTNNLLDGGWIEDIDGVTVLHLNGSNYEMGYQQGYLLRDNIPINLRILFNFLNDYGMSYDDIVDKWNVMKEHIPETYFNEIQGVVDGSGLSLEEIGVLNIFHDIINILECCGASAWGSATIDGCLVHLRSGDLSMTLQDPETGTYLQENQILVVREPDYGYASMYPGMGGDIGSYGGINEKGIGVSETTCYTDDTTLNGNAVSLRMRMVHDFADSIEEAHNIMNANRTVGWNLLISDGSTPEGIILEQTANVSYISTWDDPVESTAPFWMIENVMRRTNCFVSPECAAKDREHYNPRGFRGLFRFLFYGDHSFVAWTHYRALSKGFEKHWGKLDLNTTMDMLRDVYRGRTNIIFYIMMKLSFYQPVHQWVAYPETGEMVISFASIENMACYEPVHYFNLFKLLEAEPPD